MFLVLYSVLLTDKLFRLYQMDQCLRQLLTAGFKMYLPAEKYFQTIRVSTQFTLVTHPLLKEFLWWLLQSWTLAWASRRLRRWEGVRELERSKGRIWAEGEALSSPFLLPIPSLSPTKSLSPTSPKCMHLPPALAMLWAWYDHSLDKHSSTMRSQKCFFPLLLKQSSRNAFGFWVLMAAVSLFSI